MKTVSVEVIHEPYVGEIRVVGGKYVRVVSVMTCLFEYRPLGFLEYLYLKYKGEI